MRYKYSPVSAIIWTIHIQMRNYLIFGNESTSHELLYFGSQDLPDIMESKQNVNDHAFKHWMMIIA